ncbi:MAG: sigma-54-dependent Fis family transcriptional regulator [Candidatus Hydrogenedentes bacterium]|nr:sigma-54-dependent Fis family transcriptional regulator [Candidatus Hydrogenedentota bacterium]
MGDATILIVDDEPEIRRTVSMSLSSSGFNVVSCPDALQALELVKELQCTVAIVDLFLPGISGMETARKIRSIDSDTEIIVLTGNATRESALDAPHEHAFEFLKKPLEVPLLLQAVERAQRVFLNRKQERALLSSLAKEREALRKEIETVEKRLDRKGPAPASLLGDSRKIRQIRDQISVVAPSLMTVLIRGESGTGKDIVAQLLHRKSGRATNQRLVKVNCPALPESLLESELFGYERGAFTSAVSQKPGRFELAEGGTILLDEIGALSVAVQAKLLQVIEHKVFTRIGGTEPIAVDTRVLAATNSPLENMISTGEFREDLFYRLERYTITVPPLREHIEDLPILVDHFLSRYGPRYERPNLSLSEEFISRLKCYHWPGNVRELEAMLERYALTGDVASIEEQLHEKQTMSMPSVSATKPGPSEPSNGESEAEVIRSALAEARWNRRRAASVLGMTYGSLRRRIAKYNLD